MTGRIAGVILAGGRSSRMGGGDKCLRLIGGRPMLAHIIERLRPQLASLALNANGNPARFAAFGLPVIADRIENLPGPLAGILAGLEWAADEPGQTHIVTLPSDTPLIPADLVSRLLRENDGSESRIVLASSASGVHPVVGLWPATLAPALERFLAAGEMRVMGFARQHELCMAEFPELHLDGRNIDPFFNVNTLEELAMAEQLMAT